MGKRRNKWRHDKGNNHGINSLWQVQRAFFCVFELLPQEHSGFSSASTAYQRTTKFLHVIRGSPTEYPGPLHQAFEKFFLVRSDPILAIRRNSRLSGRSLCVVTIIRRILCPRQPLFGGPFVRTAFVKRRHFEARQFNDTPLSRSSDCTPSSA